MIICMSRAASDQLWQKKQMCLASLFFFSFLNAPPGKSITKPSLSGPRAESDVEVIQIISQAEILKITSDIHQQLIFFFFNLSACCEGCIEFYHEI